jgi:TIR domain
VIRFELNGQPVTAANIADATMRLVIKKVAEAARAQIGSIRDPETGEFPTVVVYANSFDDIQAKVEGSPKLMELIRTRFGSGAATEDGGQSDEEVTKPSVFLSYGGEDENVATRIANQMMASGIPTWFAPWDVDYGDSLRQGIDDGIANCTHFVALLSPRSRHKPWVNVEMDGGLSRKLSGKARMIVLRLELSAAELPPTLAGLRSPEVRGPEFDVSELICHIQGISRKPPLGAAPHQTLRDISTASGYSPAAMMIAKLFVEETTDAGGFDPQISREQLLEKTKLSDEDAVDALYELRNFINTDRWDGTARPEHGLYTEFDEHWKPWSPAEDALRLAADKFNGVTMSTDPAAVAAHYGWLARRLNPAFSYLLARDVLQSIHALGSGPWIVATVYWNDDELRRFVKARA